MTKKQSDMRLFAGLVLLLLSAAMGTALAQEPVKMTSPSGKITASVWTENGALKYAVDHTDAAVLFPSDMQWSMGETSMGRNSEVLSVKKGKKIRTRYPFMGNHSMATNIYRPYTISLREGGKVAYTVEFRVYNDGVAFRYLASSAGETVVDDQTTFCLPDGVDCWMQGNRTCYEGAYRHHRSGQLEPGAVAGPPVTVRYVNGIYSSITEGGLVNFGGMALTVISPSAFRSTLAGETRLGGGDIATPWRVVMIGSLNDLVNNDIVTDVSAPLSPVFGGDLSWIKPGNCVWSWLAGYGVTYENMVRFTDWAARLGIEYQLVDEGWSHWEDKEHGKDCWQMVQDLIDYSARKGVKIMLWKAYPDRKGIEGIQTPERRRAFFKKCKDMGVVGLKIDFFDSEAQHVTRYFEETLREAAEFGLMINFHGSDKPTGLSRTYPNEVTREGVMGLEFGCSWADQNTVTPFTRFLAGHGDYTPLPLQKNWRGSTTETHQIATTALFLSPLRCYGGRPEDYLVHPARELFLSMPTVWDETVVLPPSEIEECVLMAKRSGKDWYVVGLSNTHEVTADVPLDFLGRGSYKATICADNAEGLSTLSTVAVGSKARLQVSMPANGGYVARLTPVR